MPFCTIYVLADQDQGVTDVRLFVAREIPSDVAAMATRVINAVGKGDDKLTINEVLVNIEMLDSATWNASPLWLHVRPGRTIRLEQRVHYLRGYLSEGFRAILLDPKFKDLVEQGKVDRFDVEVSFLDSWGHAMTFPQGFVMNSWGNVDEHDRGKGLVNYEARTATTDT